MYVVIMGARDRVQPEDEVLVNELLDQLRNKYPALVVVSAACDKGIGRYVKARCAKDKESFQFLEVSVHVYANSVPKVKMGLIYVARNATTFELGDEFHLFVDSTRRGTIEDLVERVQNGKRPLFVYEPGSGLTSV